VTLSGTTTGTRITISSTYLGPPPELPGASPTPAASPSATPKPNATPTPAPTPSSPPVGPARDITVSGSFSEELTYPVGHWRITVTSYATGLEPVAQDTEVTIQEAPPTPLQLVIDIVGRTTTMTVSADGSRVTGLDRVRVSEGETYSATAQNEFCVRTQNAGAIHLQLDGEALGLLGRSGQSGSWIIRRGEQPQPSETSC